MKLEKRQKEISKIVKKIKKQASKFIESKEEINRLLEEYEVLVNDTINHDNSADSIRIISKIVSQ